VPVTWELRAAFARRLAAMYGREVPAYETLVEVTREINAEVVGRDRDGAQRLGSVERVSAERHGAIRVGTPRELAQAARVFAAFGMHPVGFYDLRDTGPGAVPVVSTAFRPIDSAELARNPFRVFTSMLVVDDPRYFAAGTQARLQASLAERVLFAPELLVLADRAAAEGGLPSDAAEELLQQATAAFALSREPVDRAWYDHLDAISSVAADIGGVPTTHLNHLTPRVLDIDALQARMRARGVEMIDEIQGPPGWEGPDVLLRQTSFRALAEERVFRYPDGSVRTGALRVRFGEVEQRGIALTPRGRTARARCGGGTCRRPSAGWRSRGWRSSPTAWPVRPRPRRRVCPRWWTRVRSCRNRSSTRTSCPARRPGSSAPTSPARAPATRAARRRSTTSRGWPGCSARPCTTPWTSTPRSRTRRCAPRRRSWASGSSPAVPTSTTSRGA